MASEPSSIPIYSSLHFPCFHKLIILRVSWNLSNLVRILLISLILIRTKMWDPVKDCSDPNSTQADVPGLLSAHHASAETLMHSTASGFTSTGPLSTLPPHFRDTSGQEGQQSVESMTRGSVLTGIQPRHHGNLHDHDHDHAQEQGQMTGIETRMHTSIASPEVAHPLDPQTNMSQATSMMRDAETLAQQSRRSEAIQAYEEACALLQDVIIRSFSLEERMACNNMVSQ